MITIKEKANRRKLIAAALIFVLSFSMIAAFAMEDDNAGAIKDDETPAKTVRTAQELADAVTTEGFNVILGDNITLDDVLNINVRGAINGNGKTISANPSSTWEGRKSLINVQSGVMLENLVVDNSNASYGVNIFHAGIVGLACVESKDSAGAGFTITRTTVEANTILTSGNERGGINVDSGTLYLCGENTSLKDGLPLWTTCSDVYVYVCGYEEYSWGKIGDSNPSGTMYFLDGKITEKFTLPASDYITIDDGKTLTISKGVTSNIDGKILGRGTLENNGKISLSGDISAKVTGDGSIERNWENVEIRGILQSDLIGKSNQRIIVTGNLDVRSNMEIYGELEVSKEATVTLKEGSNLTLMGNSKATINGDIVADGPNAFVMKPYSELISEGSFKVSGLNGFIIENNAEAIIDGEIIVNGNMTGVIHANGNVIISSVMPETNLFVYLGEKSRLNIVAVNGSVTVADLKITDDPIPTTENMVELTNVGGIEITSNANQLDNNETNTTTRDMSISGSTKGDDAAIVIKSGVLTVAMDENLVLNNVDLTIDGGKLVVDGNIAADKIVGNNYTEITNKLGSIDILGEIVTVGPIIGTANAAYYTIQDPDTGYNIHHYTTLTNALNSAKNINLTGNVPIDRDMTISPEKTIIFDKDSCLEVPEDMTLTITDGAVLMNSLGSISVYGKVIVEDFHKSMISDSNVHSDVDSADGLSRSYTSIVDALENASPGDKITLRSPVVTISSDSIVNDGVTVQIDNGKTMNVEDSEFIINGNVIINDGGTYNHTSTKGVSSSKTVVNGLLQFEADSINQYKNIIDGAYFIYNSKYTVAPLEFVADNINYIDGDIIIYGTVSFDKIAIESARSRTLFVDGNLSADTLTLSNIKFNSTGADNVNGTIETTNGSVQFTNVVNTVITDDNTSIILGGNPSVGSFPSSGIISISSGMVSLRDDADASISEEVKLIVEEDSTLNVDSKYTIKEVTVYGTMTIRSEDVKITTANVFGTLSTTKTLSLDTLYAGTSASDLEVNVPATIGDGVTLDDTSGVAYVSSDSIVGSGFNSLKKTEYYVEGFPYVTIYTGTNNTEINIETLTLSITNARFISWVDENNNKITGYIGSAARVYADLNYLIYSVSLSSIPGVYVYIDGAEFTTASNGKEMFAAGEHEITVYVKAGYEGTPNIVIDDKEITDGSFVIDGDSTNKIEVSGVAAVNYMNNNGGMTLIEILLVILVVIVVILATVVILRMMRS